MKSSETQKKSLRVFEIDQRLVDQYFNSYEEILKYRQEVYESGLLESLRNSAEEFGKNVIGETVRGNQYELADIGMEEGIYLYSILRKLKPDVAVETGVCNGFSTAFILLALETNTNGFLYSLDMPEIADVKYEAGVFWDGKKGAVIPRDQQPGWAIPTHLKDRWNLTIGRSQDCLPNLLEKLKSIDFFIHDSEHSYECQYFECTESFKVLKEGGVLMVDDVEWNSSFYDFANEKNKEIIHIGSDLGFFVK